MFRMSPVIENLRGMAPASGRSSCFKQKKRRSRSLCFSRSLKRLVIVPGSDHARAPRASSARATGSHHPVRAQVAHALTKPKVVWGEALREFLDEGR